MIYSIDRAGIIFYDVNWNWIYVGCESSLLPSWEMLEIAMNPRCVFVIVRFDSCWLIKLIYYYDSTNAVNLKLLDSLKLIGLNSLPI